MNRYNYNICGFEIVVSLSRNPYGSHSAVYEYADDLDLDTWDKIYGDVQVARELQKDLELAIDLVKPEPIPVIAEALAAVLARLEPTEFGSAIAFTKTEAMRLSIGERCRARQYKNGSVYLVEPGRRRGRRRGAKAD